MYVLRLASALALLICAHCLVGNDSDRISLDRAAHTASSSYQSDMHVKFRPLKRPRTPADNAGPSAAASTPPKQQTSRFTFSATAGAQTIKMRSRVWSIALCALAAGNNRQDDGRRSFIDPRQLPSAVDEGEPLLDPLDGDDADGDDGIDDPSIGPNCFSFGCGRPILPRRRAKNSVAQQEKSNFAAATERVRQLFSRVFVAQRPLSPSVDDAASTAPATSSQASAPTGPASSQAAYRTFIPRQGNCCGDGGIGSCPHDMAYDDVDGLPAVVVCADCNRTRCPLCDREAHAQYSTIHPQRVATYPGGATLCLDCNQFVNTKGCVCSGGKRRRCPSSASHRVCHTTRKRMRSPICLPN